MEESFDQGNEHQKSWGGGDSLMLGTCSCACLRSKVLGGCDYLGSENLRPQISLKFR